MASIAVHVAVIAQVLVLRAPMPVAVPGPEVVQVSLVSPDITTPVEAPPVVKPPPPRVAPAVEPEKGEGVKLTPPKPVKTPPPAKPEPERPVQAPAVPWAKVG